MFSRDELARSKERNEKQPRRRATGRLKKKKRKNSKPEKYYKDGRIVYKKDRLITSRCNVSSGSFTFHFLLDLRFPSFHPLLSNRNIYIFFLFPRRCLSVEGKKEQLLSPTKSSQVHLTNFFDRISRRGREKRKEKRTVLFSFNNYLSREREIIRNLFPDSTGSSLALIYSMSTNRKHNRFVTRHWIYLQQR